MTKPELQTNPADQETAVTREAAAERAPEPVDHRRGEKPLPDWTKRYPPEHRRELASFGTGMDPDEYPRGHELNLRLVELVQAFDKAGNDRRHKIVEQTFSCAVSETHDRVRARRWPWWTLEGNLEEFDRREPLPARSVEEVEVQPGWMDMYPAGYACILAAHGVPTVAGSVVDNYNRRLIELVPPDCTDEAELRRAAHSAGCYVFGGICSRGTDDDDGPDWECPWHDHDDDLEAVCWSYYPHEHRQLLATLGRPDYDHPNAAHYNHALVAVALSMREDGPLDQAALMRFRRRLWAAFFDDAPCPA